MKLTQVQVKSMIRPKEGELTIKKIHKKEKKGQQKKKIIQKNLKFQYQLLQKI